MMRFDAMPGSLRRLARLGVLGACLGVPVGFGFVSEASVVAQAPPASQQGVEAGIERTYVNSPFVKLPVVIDPAQRAQLRGLVLFMKEGGPAGQAGWTKVDQGSPQQTEFIFRAQREGEYWFRIVAIDVQGRPQPSDLNRDLQDAVVVVVDATAPTIELRYLGSPNEGITVQCDVKDANPDALQTHFAYQTQDQVWRPLDPIPGRPGQYCIPRQAVITNIVKVMATDLAHNAATRVYNLGELANGRGTSGQMIAAVSPDQVMPAPIPAVTPGTIPPPPPPHNVAKELPPVMPPINGVASIASGPSASSIAPPPIPAFNPIPAMTNAQSSTPMITTPDTSRGQGSTIAVTQGNGLRTPRDVSVIQSSATSSSRTESPLRPAANAESTAPITTTGNLASRQPKSPTQVVGNPTVYLNYDFENLGASGVGRVQVWATNDNGQTWTKMVDDPNCKKPAEVTFPGEGLYGVKLVASNGRGYGAEPPQSGDPADWWIEVDTTKPAASITAIKCGTGAESGTLSVFWKAEDKNLADDGIDLYYSATTEGPWHPVAKNLRNDKGFEGEYRWTPPAQAGAQSYLRLVVRDRAGNTAISQTVQPIPLDDMSRPRVRVLNVTTAPQPAPATAPATLNPPAVPRSGLVPVQATSVPEMPSLPMTGPKLGVDNR